MKFRWLPVIVSIFNQYFTYVFTEEYISSLPKLNFPTIAGFTFDHLSVSPSDVHAAVDLWTCTNLWGAAELTVPPAAIFNKSLVDGVLPLDWVSANITPVFKKDNNYLVYNYHQLV